MKNILIIIVVTLIILAFYKNFVISKESYQNTVLFKNYVTTAKCLQGDTEDTNSYFSCKLSSTYSPININVSIVKYQNFSPDFSQDDLNLLGTDDYKTMMKVISYQNAPSFRLLDTITNQVIIEKASLDNNSFLYLPDSIVDYIKNLQDLNLLQPFIDINKISTLSDIGQQFSLYLTGYLLFSEKPSVSKWKLEREICVILSEDKKSVITIQFNQTISYLDTTNNPVVTKTTTNINTEYTYLMIYPYVTSTLNKMDFINPIISKINMYGDTLKKRKIVTEYQVNELIHKLNTIDTSTIQYVLIYHTINENADDTFGFSLVKRINTNLVFINYFEIPLKYYKNLCDDQSNYVFKGRCYSACPSGYVDIGLSCIQTDASSDVISLFDPDSNYCKQICKTSDDDVSVYDPIIQKACWCKSMKCDKCSEYNIKECNC
jgi:hypothetical protein